MTASLRCALHGLPRGVVAAIAVAAFLDAPASVAAQESVPDGVSALSRAWVAAYEAGDVVAMEDLYAEDAVRMPYDAPAAEGRQAILAAYREQFASRSLRPRIELTSEEALLSGDLAIERGRYAETWVAADEAVQSEEHGKYVAVVRQGADGKWRYRIAMFNRDGVPRRNGAVEVTVFRPDGTSEEAAAETATVGFTEVFGHASQPGDFAFRMRVPPHWTMQPHVHDATEHLTVISGAIEMSFSRNGDRVLLPAGSYVSVPAGTPMWAWSADGPAVIQVHGTGPLRTTNVEP